MIGQFPEVLDSSMLATFKSCPEMFKKIYIEQWKPRGLSVHLHAGASFAKGLEVARQSFYVENQPADLAVSAGLGALLKAYGDFECPSDSAKSAERMAGAFEFYFDSYPLASDECVPCTLPGGKRGIEFSFTHILPLNHPSGNPLLYCGRMDMLANFAGGVFIEDDKTTSSLGASWSRQWDLRSQFTGYCLTSDTEVLSTEGWLSIDKVTLAHKVAQWDNGNLSFVHPTELHSPDFKGSLITSNGKTSITGTPNHRQIVFDTYSNEYKTYTLDKLPKTSGALRFLSAGKLEGNEVVYSEALIRLVVAAQADGTWRNKTGLAFHFTKDRKAKRLLSLLEELGATFSIHTTKDNSFSCQLTKSCVVSREVYNLIGPNKKFGAWLLSLSQLELEAFIEEIQYWDDSSRGTRDWMYFSNDKENVEWVRTVAAITGHYSSVHSQKKGSYRVYVSKSCLHAVHLQTWGTIPWNDKVYCITVPSSYFIIRKDGKHLITGNSWGCREAGIKADGVLVRGVSILKTKYDTQQAISYRPEWQVDRWFEETLQWIKDMLICYETGVWRHNLDHACAEYGGCQFRQACMSQDETPWLNQYFERRHWDPITRIETRL